MSASTHKTSVAVCGCPRLSVSTHRTSVAVRMCLCVSVGVRQHTLDVRGCPSAHTECPCVSLDSARQPFPWIVRVILAHAGSLFSTHRTSVGVCQDTQDVRGCLCVSVCVCQHTQEVCGCPSVHISARWSFLWTVWVILPTWADCSVHTGHPWMSASIHRRSVAVRGSPPAHTGRPWLSVCVRVCPSAYT